MCSQEERGEISSSSAGVASPPVPRPANRRGPRGLDARQIVLLLIHPSELKHLQPSWPVSCGFTQKCSLDGCVVADGWSALKRVNRCDHHPPTHLGYIAAATHVTATHNVSVFLFLPPTISAGSGHLG